MRKGKLYVLWYAFVASLFVVDWFLNRSFGPWWVFLFSVVVGASVGCTLGYFIRRSVKRRMK